MFHYSAQIRVLEVSRHELQQVWCITLGASEDNIQNGHLGLLAGNSNQINRASSLVNNSSLITRVQSMERSRTK